MVSPGRLMIRPPVMPGVTHGAGDRRQERDRFLSSVTFVDTLSPSSFLLPPTTFISGSAVPAAFPSYSGRAAASPPSRRAASRWRRAGSARTNTGRHPAGEVDRRDGADAGGRAAHAAHPGDRSGGIDVRRQVQDHRRERRIGERRDREAGDEQQERRRCRRSGIRNIIPMPPNTPIALRAAPTLQPRLISALDTPPPKKLPRSAARKGTQNAGQALLERESARHEVDREPVGDEEPDRIGAAPCR